MTRAFCLALCAAAIVQPPLVAGALRLRHRPTGDRPGREVRLVIDTTVLPPF